MELRFWFIRPENLPEPAEDWFTGEKSVGNPEIVCGDVRECEVEIEGDMRGISRMGMEDGGDVVQRPLSGCVGS